MLIGRDDQLTRLYALVEDTAGGSGRSLLLHGQPGAGKSALLECARLAAQERGVRVLMVPGYKGETELAFSALCDLLGPVTDGLDHLPAPQAAAVASALALAPSNAGDRLALCVATLRLLEHASTAQPLLVIVDDLMGVDCSSRECIVFAARRVKGQLAMLLAARDEDLTGDHTGSFARLDRMFVPPLADAEMLQVLKQVAPDMADPVATVVVRTADGNPTAARDLTTALDTEQRSGLTEVPNPLKPGREPCDLYQARMAAFPSHTRMALLIAAAYQGDDLRVVGAASAALGIGVGRLAEAEDANLVRISAGRLSFTPPLVRGAVYHGSPCRERRLAHGALASVLHGESRAWHLGLAALGPDEDVARELEVAGRAALIRVGPGPTSSVLERAALLSPDPERAAQRLLSAGEFAISAGMSERALVLLGRAAEVTGDPAARGLAHLLTAQALLLNGGLPVPIDMLAQEAEQTRTKHPSLAAAMLSEAALASQVGADYRRAQRLAEEAADLIEPDAPVDMRAHVAVTLQSAQAMGGVLDRRHALAAEAESLMQSVDPLSVAGQRIAAASRLRGWGGDFERVRDDAHAACVRARQQGILSAIPMLYVAMAECNYRLGAWPAAEEAALEAVVTGQDLKQLAAAHCARLILVRLAASRGVDERKCRDAIASIKALADATGVLSLAPIAIATLGFMELGLGRIEPAIEHLEWVAEFFHRSGMEEPTCIPWEADLVEAYLRAGNFDDAARTLAVMGRRAGAAGVAVADALHRRCCGMMSKDFDEHFAASLEADDERPMPFERARTLLAYGRRLHREKRRTEARAVLHGAFLGFEAMGARPWAVQAHAELLAAGGRKSSATAGKDTVPTTLTAHERRVAQTIARGLSNRQAAAELFLSSKTIEFHLMHIYRKLGINSRIQLADALRRTDTADQR